MKVSDRKIDELVKHISNEENKLEDIHKFLSNNVIYLEDIEVKNNTIFLSENGREISVKFLDYSAKKLPQTYTSTDKIYYILEGRIMYRKYEKEFNSTVNNSSIEILGAGEVLNVTRDTIYNIYPEDETVLTVLLEITLCDNKTEKSTYFEKYKNKEQTVDSTYYYGYDERYKKVYEAGALTWETQETNEPILRLDSELDLTNKRIIDLGCGEGRDTLYLSKKGYNVIGVDVSRNALRKARALAENLNMNIKFLERDVVHLRGIEQNQFDIALNMGCLHMIPEPEHRKAHLDRVFQILKPGGLFFLAHCKDKWLQGFFSVPNYEEVGEVTPGKVIKRRIRVEDGTKMVDLPLIPYKESSEAALIDEVAESGFKVVKSYSENTDAFGNTVVLLLEKPID